MKKLIYIFTIALFIILPCNVNAALEVNPHCDDIKTDGKNQFKTCYIDIKVTEDTTLYSTSGKFTMINTSLKGNIEAGDKRIKITNSNLDNLTFVSETPIKNETVRIAKFIIYLATNGEKCIVQWEPKTYGTNYSCTFENGYYYDKNGNSVTETEYNKQCKPHYCEIIDNTYFDKSGNIVDKNEYSKQCEKHYCEVIDNTYFDKNGNVVDKNEYSKQCEKHSCEIIDNTYFDKNGNIVDKNEYSKQCEKHSCEIVNGVYFGKNGNIVTDKEYDKQCNKHFCKIIDGTYFGKNGDLISKAEYNVQCPTDNPKTSGNSIFGYALIATLISTFISIILCIKQNSKKVYKI